MDRYEEKKQAIIDYFKSGEKDIHDFKVGVEFEHIIVDIRTYESISLYGKNGVSKTIEALNKYGWVIDYQEGFAVGATKGPYTISTEPAGQFEVSIDANKSVEELESEYIIFLEEINPILKEKNQRLLGIGYHPVTVIDDIKISPKKRYGYMYNHFKDKGSRSHNMMKGTAAVQVILDYNSQEDFIRKYRLGSALSPILYTIFENAYIFEGKPVDFHGVRQYIWKNTDPERSGLVKTAFDKDFSYEKYAEYILDTDVIFIDDEKGLRSTEGLAFKDVFDLDGNIEEQIFHAVSIVFPDLRLKKYLEFRMMDSLPYPLNFAPVSLIKGLFYNEENLNRLEELFKDVNYELVNEAKEKTKARGIEAEYLGKSIYEWSLELMAMAEKGLNEREKKLLNPLKELVEMQLTPRDKFKINYDNFGLEVAARETIVEV